MSRLRGRNEFELIMTLHPDRETMEEHYLTVMVKDQGTPSKRNYARVLVKVHDHNDHAPEFVTAMVQGKVFETSEIGSTVVRVVAIDRDREENGRISYSIISGESVRSASEEALQEQSRLKKGTSNRRARGKGEGNVLKINTHRR